MGHPLRIMDMTSGTHAILRTSRGLSGGADPRREGTAKGY
jgi:gamma-glutamyltranspeptidase/glutathione hydrolase